jgi:hypothetical protein
MKSVLKPSLSLIALLSLLSYQVETMKIINIYEGLQLISKTGTIDLRLDDPDKFNLRKIDHSETDYTLIFEYDLGKEGILVMSQNYPDNAEDSQFKIFVDYITKDIPFILGSLHVDTTNIEHQVFDEIFSKKDFVDGLMKTQKTILKNMDLFFWNTETLELFNSSIQTHRFLTFQNGTFDIATLNFPLKLNNDEIAPDLKEAIDQNKYLKISGDEFESLIVHLFENVVNYGYREVFNELEEDASLKKTELLEAKKELVRKKYDVLTEVHEMIKEYKLLVEESKEEVFDSESMEKGLEQVQHFFNGLEDNHINFAGGLFYTSKYLFENGTGNKDPVMVMESIGEEVENSLDLENKFLEILHQLMSNLTEFLDKAFKANNFSSRSETIINKYIENVFEYYQRMGYKGEQDSEFIENVKSQMKRLFVDRHINEMLLYRGIDPIFIQLKEYIRLNDVEVFENVSVNDLRFGYFELGGDIEGIRPQKPEYENIEGVMFVDDMKIIL